MNSDALHRRVAVHAALGEPVRLAMVDDLAVSDRSPTELGARHALPSNLLAHHLDVLETAGVIVRFSSSGDGRRKYVRLDRAALTGFGIGGGSRLRPALFVCTHNSARSQLASALWAERTGGAASSAGTHPADDVHRGARAAARRAGLDLADARPAELGRVARGTQVITVCDRAHEELEPGDDWWHWSIPDPIEIGTAAAFDAVVAELEDRIRTLVDHRQEKTP